MAMTSSEEPPQSLESQNKNLTPQQLKALSKRIQQTSYGPEFLKEFARKLPTGSQKDNGPRFKVVTGKEADSIYHSVVSEDDHDHKGLSIRPVVLAFPVQEAGRKVVDYYMTWRGKTKTHRLKGDNRDVNFLDNEFKKVRKTLDNEFHNASPVPRPPIPLDSKPHSSPDVLQSTADMNPDSPRPPSLASVTSLPLLGMVRGVPLTNRIPLRVLNPDPVSPTPSIIRDSGVFPGIEAVISNPLQVVPEVVPVPAVSTSDAPQPSGPKKDEASVSTPSAEKKRSRRMAGSPHSENGNAEDKGPDSNAESPEILIVLMDEKDGDQKSKKAQWHGLERQIVKRRLARKPSHRPSPWDGPIAKSGSGQIQRYHSHSLHRLSHRNSNGSGYSSYDTEGETSGESSGDSSDEEWKDQPVVPIDTTRSLSFINNRDGLAALGYITPTPSLTNGSFTYSPVPSTLSLHGPAPSTYNGYLTSPQNAPYPTPYPTPYNSPYSSPYAVSAPSLPGTYLSPYVSSQQWLPAESPMMAAGAVAPASVISSPYVPPPRPLSAWGNRSMGSVVASNYSSPYIPAQNGLHY